MLALARDVWKFRELLLILVQRNIKIRYKRSALGFLWTLLNPIFLILIYAVFLRILRFYDPANALFLPMLVVGIIAWQFLAMCLGDSLHAVLGNANLVKKTAFPRLILPLSMVLANLFNFLCSLPIVALYILLVGAPTAHGWLLPLVVLTQTALCLGLSLLLSAANVLFRDTEHLLGVGLLAWFFMSPIIYPFSQVPAAFQRLAMLNPMAGIVVGYRAVFIDAGIPAPRLLAVSLGVSWLVLVLGLSVFQRLQRGFGDRI